MKEEIRYRWTITQNHTTEQQIRRDQPEAKCLEHARQVQMVPETDQDVEAALQMNFTSGFMRK